MGKLLSLAGALVALVLGASPARSPSAPVFKQQRAASDAPPFVPDRAALVYGLGHESQFVFDAGVMQRISREAIAEGSGDVDATVAATVRKLRETYPKCAP